MFFFIRIHWCNGQSLCNMIAVMLQSVLGTPPSLSARSKLCLRGEVWNSSGPPDLGTGAVGRRPWYQGNSRKKVPTCSYPTSTYFYSIPVYIITYLFFYSYGFRLNFLFHFFHDFCNYLFVAWFFKNNLFRITFRLFARTLILRNALCWVDIAFPWRCKTNNLGDQ